MAFLAGCLGKSYVFQHFLSNHRFTREPPREQPGWLVSWLAAVSSEGLRPIGGSTLWIPPGELPPPLDDHVVVEGIEIHQECPAAGLLGGDQSAQKGSDYCLFRTKYHPAG